MSRKLKNTPSIDQENQTEGENTFSFADIAVEGISKFFKAATDEGIERQFGRDEARAKSRAAEANKQAKINQAANEAKDDKVISGVRENDVHDTVQEEGPRSPDSQSKGLSNNMLLGAAAIGLGALFLFSNKK